MSRDVQLQADIGSLGLQGLGAFTSILATLSADNVSSLALIQLEQLGSNFPVNGKLAEDVKGLLQRCKDKRLDHFAFAIGWRKNDSASLMAASAGGQAVALLCVCLTSLYRLRYTGLLLAGLCSKLCSSAVNISSIVQLADVANLLAGKANALGFGNLLAREVTRIHGVYHALGRHSAPARLLDDLELDSMTELLEKVSQALRQESKICRISGSRAMGHISGLLQALFPHNFVLVIEGVIVQDVDNSKIRCEIVDSADCCTRINLETTILDSMSVRLPIEHLDLTSSNMRNKKNYTFNWSNWLADYLRLVFMNYGLTCNHSIMKACCNLLVSVPAFLYIDAIMDRSEQQISPSPRTNMLALLGPLPRARMCLICEQILGCTPAEELMDPPTAFANFVKIVTDASDVLICECGKCLCDWSDGWPSDKEEVSCARRLLWSNIGRALNSGFWSFLVDAGPDVTICRGSESSKSPFFYSRNTDDITKSHSRVTTRTADIYRNVLDLINAGGPCNVFASSNSCTLYPTVIETMKLPSHQQVKFTMLEGRIVHENRYHRSLDATPFQARPSAEHSLMDRIVPSHIGGHAGSPLLTIRNNIDDLEMHMSVEYDKTEVKLDLRDVIQGYMGMVWSNPCTHPVNNPLDSSRHAARATSVASPAATGRLGVAMTRWNPTAQLLCCSFRYQAVLQKECCLDCAVGMLDEKSTGVIIVAC